MPTVLADFEHELLPGTGGAGIVFGKVGSTYFTTEHPQITGGDDRFGDVDLEREDGVGFGEDYSSGKTIAFDIGVATWDEGLNAHEAGADALENLEREWKNPIYRTRATAYAMLRSRAVPGRTRVAYGRPRRYAEATNRLTHKGFSTVLCDFQTIDGRWYDDVEDSNTSNLVQPPTGGFKSPIKAPIVTSPPAVSVGRSITVGGTVPTWPVVEIYGPISQPVVTLGPLVIAFTGQLLDGESVTFDPRPWSRTVLRNDGASFAGKLGYQTPPLRLCSLPPGEHAFNLAGNDETGTASATVRWRNAYSRW